MTTPTQSPPETPDLYGAFPRLSDEQIETLAAHGERRRPRPGEVLFREGDRSYDFFVILDGNGGGRRGVGRPRRALIAVHGPGRFLGELGLLTGQAVVPSRRWCASRARCSPCRSQRLRELVAHDPALGDLILRAYLLRRDRC